MQPMSNTSNNKQKGAARKSESTESIASNTSTAPLVPGEFPVEKYIKIEMKPRNGSYEPHFLLIWEGDTCESWNPCRFTAHANPSNRIGILNMIRRSFEENSELEYEPAILDYFEESAIDWRELRRQGRAGWDTRSINPRRANVRQGQVERLMATDNESETDTDVDEEEEQRGRSNTRRIDMQKVQQGIAHLQLKQFTTKTASIPEDYASPTRRYGKGSEHRSPLPSGVRNLPPPPFELRDHLPPLVHPIRAKDPGVIAQEVVRAREARRAERAARRAAAEKKAIEQITKMAKNQEDKH